MNYLIASALLTNKEKDGATVLDIFLSKKHILGVNGLLGGQFLIREYSLLHDQVTEFIVLLSIIWFCLRYWSIRIDWCSRDWICRVSRARHGHPASQNQTDR
jgi:hypothetical protein